MMSPEEAFGKTTYHVGGVCPFALPDEIGIFLDVSLKNYLTVFPAAGTSHSAVEMTPEELSVIAGGAWVDICG
jgi:prolyl-tRNA editing enzyme YbaK/EbsC (Cys-tRNA(Pro) deacylase)